MKNDTRRIEIRGTAVAVRGDDMDTDRIIPARYLRTVTFDGLGNHAFEDDRAELTAAGEQHSFDNPAHSQAQILLANKNFGCGSSREHAPQSLLRWNKGITAIVAESFAEIFNTNCFTLGVPCICLSAAQCEQLMQIAEANPSLEFVVDLEHSRLVAGDVTILFEMPEGIRQRFLTGSWDSTGELLGNLDSINRTAAQLPYLSGFSE